MGSALSYERHELRFVDPPDAPTLPSVGAGPVGWWDAADGSAAGMTLTGGRVSTWKDKSGSGFDGAPSANLSRIRYDIPNRRMLFAAGQNLVTSCPADDRTQTCFFSGIVESLAAPRPLVGGNGNGARLFRIETTGKLSILRQFVDNLFTTTTLAVTVGSPFVACAIINTTTIEIRLNRGTPETTSNSSAFTAGRVTRLIQDGNSLDTFLGGVGEILVYGTALASADATAVMNYLMAKWGV